MKKKMLFSKKGQRGWILLEVLLVTALIIIATGVGLGLWTQSEIRQLPEYKNFVALVQKAKAAPSSVTEEQLKQALENFRSAVSNKFGESAGSQVMIRAQEAIEKIKKQQYIIKIIVSPADPAPYENVSVTVTVLNSLAGTLVSRSVVGTDGYTQSGTLSTDTNGQIFFTIPGGAKGIVDVVTITAGSVTEKYTYTF